MEQERCVVRFWRKTRLRRRVFGVRALWKFDIARPARRAPSQLPHRDAQGRCHGPHGRVQTRFHHYGRWTEIGKIELELAGPVSGIQRRARDVSRQTQKPRRGLRAVRTDQRDSRRLVHSEAPECRPDANHGGIKSAVGEDCVPGSEKRRSVRMPQSLLANELSNHLRIIASILTSLLAACGAIT